MKLAIDLCSLTERFGDVPSLQMVWDAGFRFVDYSFYSEPAVGWLREDNYVEIARSIRAEMDARGISCRQAHAPFRLRYSENFLEDERYTYVVRSMEAASILGAKNIVVHALHTDPGVDVHEANLRYYRSLVPYCEKFGIRVAVENLFRAEEGKGWVGILGTPQKLCGMIREIGSDRFVACIDLGHAAITGTHPEDFIAGMEPELLCALHVQDTDYRDDCHTLPHLGQQHWDKILQALAERGYCGDLTYEIPGYLDRFDRVTLPAALRLAYDVGMQLVGDFKAYTGKQEK